MKKLMSYEIRQMWLDFFASKNHEVIPSASLVPHNDPTLLWINAGVAPLKKFFDGREIPNNRRMVNAQKSIRTNDIENVGKTARHHTFFEMLGNFSVGDYFREEALEFAIEILTSSKYFAFDINKLYFTIYPTDDASFERWVELGVSPNHIIRLSQNFWEIGEGPCGPCTEIFYDRGEKYDPEKLGKELIEKDIENERYIEIWNIVFSQYNSIPGKERSEYPELPSKNIDTGMGLERMACVLQEVETNYDTDLFMPIIRKTEEISSVKYTGQMAFKVIADHVRSVVFAVSDGATLSNEGRGYVLRRLLRRAVRFGKNLGIKKAFLYELVNVVVENMKVFYSDLALNEENVTKIIKQEEEKFLLTLELGEKKLLEYINNHSKDKNKVIAKETAFLLYDTFGFPIELTVELASEYNFEVDLKGFKEELEKQKERARMARSDNQSMNVQNEEILNFHKETEFIGYDNFECESKVVAIFVNGKSVSKADESALVLFSPTVFYAESGGQVGDKGLVISNTNTYEVTDTIKLPNMQHASLVEINDGVLTVGQQVILKIDKKYREKIAKNHTATHLLNESLRQIIGTHVYQHGSNVNASNLRFDFNNFELPNENQILEVEKLVNKEILKSSDVLVKEMSLEAAKKEGVQAVFGEKYGDIVRVVDTVFSKELCGGTHVSNTKEIERFAITSIEAKGSGIFRIEAATSSQIEKELNERLYNINSEIEDLLKKGENLVEEAKLNGIELKFDLSKVKSDEQSYSRIIAMRNYLNALRDESKEISKKYQKALQEKNSESIDKYLEYVEEINNKKVCIFDVKDVNIEVLKDLVDRLSDYLKESVVFVGSIVEDKVIFICKNKVSSLNAGLLVKKAAIICGGNGGGRPDFAQAGGKNVNMVKQALEEVKKEIEEKI
ncbi:MAG: alanine--tRNA ligase [Bacilli bacterium]